MNALQQATILTGAANAAFVPSTPPPSLSELDQFLNELRALLARGDELLARARGKDTTGISQSHLARVETIIEVVSRLANVPCRRIYSRERTDATSSARQVCMTLIRAKIGLSTYQTGQIFGRDHTAVVHAERVTNDRIAVDSKFACHFARINIEIDNQLKAYADKN